MELQFLEKKGGRIYRVKYFLFTLLFLSYIFVSRGKGYQGTSIADMLGSNVSNIVAVVFLLFSMGGLFYLQFVYTPYVVAGDLHFAKDYIVLKRKGIEDVQFHEKKIAITEFGKPNILAEDEYYLQIKLEENPMEIYLNLNTQKRAEGFFSILKEMEYQVSTNDY